MSDELSRIGLAIHVHGRDTILDLNAKLLDGWKVDHCVPYGTPNGLLVIISKDVSKDDQELWIRNEENLRLEYEAEDRRSR